MSQAADSFDLSKRLCLLILCIVSFGQYAHTIGYDFVWDSKNVLLDDPSIREMRYLPSYFTEEFDHYLPKEGGQLETLSYYRPLVKVLHLVEYNLFGENPAGYKVVSLLLSLATVLLLFLLVESITGQRSAAFIASLLYAVNPARVEAVVWVYSDSYLLVVLFGLLTLYAYHHRRPVLASIGLVLACLSQEYSVLVLPLLLLYEFFYRAGGKVKEYLRLAPFFGLFFLYLAVRHAVLSSGSIPIGSFDLLARMNTTAVLIKRFLKISFLPDAPVTIYLSEDFSKFNAEVLLSYLIVLGLVLMGWLLWTQKREYLFWYLWIFVARPLDFIVGSYGHYLMAEKGLNFVGIGLCVLMALFLVNLKLKKESLITIVAAILLFHSSLTFSRSLHWKNTLSYLEQASEFVPDFYMLHYMRGMEYVEKQEYDSALEAFKRTVELAPEHSFSHNNIGNIYYMNKRVDDAVEAWMRAIAADEYSPRPYYNVGMVLEAKGNVTEALQYYERFLSLSNQVPEPIMNHIHELRANRR